jgi:hypothetical protein
MGKEILIYRGGAEWFSGKTFSLHQFEMVGPYLSLGVNGDKKYYLIEEQYDDCITAKYVPPEDSKLVKFLAEQSEIKRVEPQESIPSSAYY